MRPRTSANRAKRWTVIFAAMCAVDGHAATPLDEVRTLLEQGKHSEAYIAAKKYPSELGNPSFDFYFGVAAINSGKVSDGVLALERYLLNFPKNQTARLELGRGYYLLGDDARARDEFDAVLANNPPAEVTRVVREYLAAISTRETRHKTTFTYSIELGGGRDSNVQSGVSDPNITLPVFGDITLADSAVATSDRFSNLTLAGRVSVPVRPRWSAFLQLGADLKQYRVADSYDQNTYSGAMGFSFSQSDALYKITLGKTSQTLDNTRYRDTTSLGLDYAKPLSNGAVFSLGAQGAKFGYAGDNKIRDANYGALQAGYRQAFSGGWKTEIDTNLSIAREDVTQTGFDALSRDLLGGRFGVSVSPLPSLTFALGGTALKSRYRAEDALLLVTRRDDYTAIDLSVNYAFNPRWSIRGEYQDARNKSNLPLYEYKRRIGQVKLRVDFQ